MVGWDLDVDEWPHRRVETSFKMVGVVDVVLWVSSERNSFKL